MASISSQVYELVAPETLVLSESIVERCLSNDVYALTGYSAVSKGTELAAWSGKPPLRPSKVYPRLMGYCNMARVKEVGLNVEGVDVGDWILTHQSHRSSFCVPSEDILCRFKGINEEYAKKLSATYLYHLGYSALLKGGYFPGHKVAVMGLGVLGYTTADLVHCFGGRSSVFTSHSYQEHLSESTAVVLDKDQAASNKEAFDLVINTSDSWDDYSHCLDILRPGGTMVLLGFPGRGLPFPSFNPLDSSKLYDKQLSISYAGYVVEKDLPEQEVRFTLKRNMQYLSELILTNRLVVSPLCSVEESWKNLGVLYQNLSNRSQGALSGVLKWD